jgi:hypothetical protein
MGHALCALRKTEINLLFREVGDKQLNLFLGQKPEKKTLPFAK